MLPEGKASDIRIAAATYAKLQEIKFLDPQNSERIGRYEQMINTLKQRNNITQAEIETSLRALIAAVVDEEFNKVSFTMSNDGIRKGYNAVLTRTANNQYILEYEGVYQGKDFHEKLPATPLDALLTQMRNNTADFDQACVDTVRAQAVLIPAVVYADWKQKGVVGGVDALALVTETITNFYLNPSSSTYNMLRGIYARLFTMSTAEKDNFAHIVNSAYVGVLGGLNVAISGKVVDENSFEMANALNSDSRYRIFSTPYRSVRR
jgi:hypothetical protein